MEAPGKRLRDYVRPKSLTWWAGICLSASGLLELTGGSVPGVSEVIRPLFKHAPETADPVSRLLLGLGVIGMYRKLDALFAQLRGGR